MIDLDRTNQLLPQQGRYKKNWKKFNFILWIVPFILVNLSCLLIASSQRNLDLKTWHHHLIISFFGFFLAYYLSQIPLERFRRLLVPLYSLTLVSLVAVKIIGTSALGSQRWLYIAGVNIQPSEIAKLTSIFILAAVLERYKFDKLKSIIRPVSIVLVPWILIFIQPDLGTSLVFGAILFVMLYWSGMPVEWMLIALSTLLTAIFASILPAFLIIWIPVIGVLAYRSLPNRRIFTSLTIGLQSLVAYFTPWFWMNGLKDYQRDRLILFLDPAKDPLGGGYHLIQSKIGIGSGGFLGTGILQGQLTKLGFIPEQHTDFIFSALGEELGFVGTSIVTILFCIFVFRLVQIAKQARTDFESLVVIGIAAMFIFQIMVNIFMTIGLGPVTGIPLPFMSYGRTALIVNFSALGLCLSVARRGQVIGRNFE